MNILNKISLSIGMVLIGGLAYSQQPIMNDQANSAAPAHSDIVDTNWMPSLVQDGIVDHVAHDNLLLPSIKSERLTSHGRLLYGRKLTFAKNKTGFSLYRRSIYGWWRLYRNFK